VTDLDKVTGIRVPRGQFAHDLARRLFPAKKFAVFAVLMFVGLSLIALMVGAITGIIIAVAQTELVVGRRAPLGANGHYVWKAILAALAFAWLLYGALILPSHVRSKRKPVREVTHDGDLFDASVIETKVLANLVGVDAKCEYVLLVERDGARVHVASPVRATKVLHRLGTHVAIAFDEHGAAHPARAWLVA
jgi:hypothetical protein